MLTQQQVNIFQQIVVEYYSAHGRDLPWRKTNDPYAIFVSEVMLQQTQVPRVIEKYQTWMARFPTAHALSQSSFSEALTYWSGLGYNRRAKYLYDCAQEVCKNYTGIFPQTPDELRKLPGMGPYTAAAVCVFAFNQPCVLLETNVRSVYLHHFFPDKTSVTDKELRPLVEQTMDTTNPRKWFNALMDYGTYLKSTMPNPSRNSKTYSKQSSLKGSVREVRGWILKQLTTSSLLPLDVVYNRFDRDVDRVNKAVEGLKKDSLIKTTRDGEIVLVQ